MLTLMSYAVVFAAAVGIIGMIFGGWRAAKGKRVWTAWLLGVVVATGAIAWIVYAAEADPETPTVGPIALMALPFIIIGWTVGVVMGRIIATKRQTG